jgi:hypothetical protein
MYGADVPRERGGGEVLRWARPRDPTEALEVARRHVGEVVPLPGATPSPRIDPSTTGTREVPWTLTPYTVTDEEAR